MILLAFAALLGCGADRGGEDGAGVVRIAVASNFVEPLEELAARFRSASGFGAVVSSGSTGALYAQIRNGAPFDVFLAADSARPARLERDGDAVSGTRITYAVGRLVLFSPTIAAVADGPEVLLDAATCSRCAIANPQTAPYGHAARQALERLQMFDAIADRIVKGANVAQTFQLVDAGGAEVGFVARSQVAKRTGGHRWLVPAELHDPLRQDAVLLKAGPPDGAARAFLSFLRGDEARRIIREWGYDDPGQRPEVAPAAVERPFDWRPIWLTLRLATITTVLLLLLGTPLAWWLARTRSRFRHAVGALTALPLVMPPTVLGFYLLVLLGPNSPIGGFWEWAGGGRLVFSFTGLVIGSVVYSMPFVVKPLHDAFEAVGSRPLEVAATLGATPRDRFFTVAVPLARPGFLTAATLGFAHTVGEFGVVLMIGGNVPGRTQVVSIAIFEHVESLSYREAHVLSAGMLVFSFVMLLLVYAVNNRRIVAPL